MTEEINLNICTIYILAAISNIKLQRNATTVLRKWFSFWCVFLDPYCLLFFFFLWGLFQSVLHDLMLINREIHYQNKFLKYQATPKKIRSHKKLLRYGEVKHRTVLHLGVSKYYLTNLHQMKLGLRKSE